MISILKQIKNINRITNICNTTTTRSLYYTTTSCSNIGRKTILNESNEEKGFKFGENNNKKEKENNNNSNNKSNNNNKNIIYSFSIGGIFNLFGGKKQQQEEENPYGKVNNRIKGTPIETFQDALDWYTGYYSNPEPELFLDAMKFLLGKQSRLFVRQQLEGVRGESENKSIARISIVQSFYYLPLVGFMIELFRQNPTQVEKWYNQLINDTEISTPWKSALGDLDAKMLINLAVVLTESNETKLLEQKILSNYFTDKDDQESKNLKSEKFKSWAYAQKKSISSLPLILIGEYFACGKEDLVKQISSIWRSSLDNLEVMGINNTDQANTTNNIQKRLEFENREMIIDQLNQAIRILANDKRACLVLKQEVENQIKAKEERIKQYNK